MQQQKLEDNDNDEDNADDVTTTKANQQSIRTFIGFKTMDFLLIFVKIFHNQNSDDSCSGRGGSYTSTNDQYLNTAACLHSSSSSSQDNSRNKTDKIVARASYMGNGWIQWPSSSFDMRNGNRTAAGITSTSLEDYLLYVRPSQIEKTLSSQWIAIDNVNTKSVGLAAATTQGKLGCQSKIAPAIGGNGGAVVCCVYVNDWTNKTEIKRVLIELQNTLGHTKVTGFKPNVYTHHDISGTIYKTKDVSSW